MSDREYNAVKRFTEDLKKSLYFHSFPLTTNMGENYSYEELENLIDYNLGDFELTYNGED